MNSFRVTAAFLLAAIALGCNAPLKRSGPEGSAAAGLPDQQAMIASYDRSRAETLFQTACERLERGEIALADQELRRVLALQTSHCGAQRLLADILIADQRYTEAEELLTELIARQPADPAAHHALGMLLSELDRTEEALHALAQAVQLAPENELYRLSLATLTVTAGEP